MRLGSTATLSTRHLAKGLEFRAVIVMACDEDVIPTAERIKAITDDSDLHPSPRPPAYHERGHLLGVRGGSERVPQPARDQLQIAHEERGMGRSEISVSHHQGR
jgi:superfamily I DNA/RNA helicase